MGYSFLKSKMVALVVNFTFIGHVIACEPSAD